MYGACLLAKIEQQITGGEPIASYFDMIAGTSTGGIMALGLGLQVPANKIEQLYREDGKAIFKQPTLWESWPILKTLSHLKRSLYDPKTLETILYREFGDKILGDSVARLVIPAFMVPKTEITVFKTDHHPDFKNDYRSKAWEVARATSAAPTYLSGHGYEDVLFLDGGVWANNPVLAAVIDALSAYDISREQIEILSIGTGNPPFEINLKDARRGLFRWREAIKAAMFLTTDNAHAQAALLLGPECITRLEPTKEAATIGLDDWKSSVGVMPQMAADHFDAEIDAIKKFFAAKVTPRHRFYSAPILTGTFAPRDNPPQ